jgi:hypothetical protein
LAGGYSYLVYQKIITYNSDGIGGTHRVLPMPYMKHSSFQSLDTLYQRTS